MFDYLANGKPASNNIVEDARAGIYEKNISTQPCWPKNDKRIEFVMHYGSYGGGEAGDCNGCEGKQRFDLRWF
jgi:hypothetical protein